MADGVGLGEFVRGSIVPSKPKGVKENEKNERLKPQDEGVSEGTTGR